VRVASRSFAATSTSSTAPARCAFSPCGYEPQAKSTSPNAMMALLTLSLATITPVLLALAFLLGRLLQTRQTRERALSPVAQQHLQIFQTGEVNETAVEIAKRRFRAMLERG